MHIHTSNFQKKNKNLQVAIVLNLIIVIGEIIGGLISNSFALISDALHNLGDLLALILTLAANKITLKKATPQKSFGYFRSEIIAAFINSSVLLLIGVYIIYEGILRLKNPTAIVGQIVLITASISFFANAVSSFFLHKDSKNNLSIKSSYLHLIYDAIHSLAVVAAGLLIIFFNLFIFDSIFSIIIGVFIFKSSWNVVTHTLNILNEGTPKEIDHFEVENFLKSLPEVINVHHLHIWQISTDFIALSVHIVINDQLLSEGFLVIDKIEKLLHEKFRINHPTIQLEAKINQASSKIIL